MTEPPWSASGMANHLSRLFQVAISPPSDRATREWMARNGAEVDRVRERARRAFFLAASAGLLLALLGSSLGAPEAVAGCAAAICAPFVASSYVANEPARSARREARSFLRHAPAVIGSMAMSMNLTPSLERAVLLASSVNHDPLGRRLGRVGWEVLTRSRADVESALADFATSLDHGNQALRQSLHLMAASSHEPTRDGMERLMEKAHEVSVQGLRQAAERYVAGLSAPVMVIFALGILLPIMLLSIVPLFALAAPLPAGVELSTNQQMPLVPMALLLLVVVPTCCLLYARSLLEASPISTPPRMRPALDRSHAWPWAAWGAVLSVLAWLGWSMEQPHLFLLALALPPSLIMARGRIPIVRRRRAADPERDFIIGLYQVGNRLSSGASLEKALAEAAEASCDTEFSVWARRALHLCNVSKLPLQEAMDANALSARWPLVAEAFRTVASCAQGDGAAAGRVAVRLAKSLGDIRDCEQGIEERLKGVVDMMRSTSLVFAPIVLGVTLGLFGLTASFAGGEGTTGAVTLMAGAYVMELCLVVSYLTTFLSGGRSWEEMLQSFAARMPVAVLVFTSVSLASHAGFARLW